jgi:hypothetical protein
MDTNLTKQGNRGVYDIIKTLNYVDGVLNTFRTLDDQKRVDAAWKASLEEVTVELTGSRHYQRKMQALERELESQQGTSNQDDGEEPDDGNLGPNGEWDNHIPDDDLKLTGKVESGSPKKMIERRKSKGRRSGAYSTSSSKDDEMSNLVKEVKEALKDMAVFMSDLAIATKGNQGEAERRRKKGDPDSNESSEDEDTPPPVKSQKKSSPKAAAADKKYYYAVAKGRVPGVYTDWGQASKQVNRFSGAVHKKFKSCVKAERVVKKYQETETDVSEDSLGPPKSESEDSSDNELPRRSRGRSNPGRIGQGQGFQQHWNLWPRTHPPGMPRNFSA